MAKKATKTKKPAASKKRTAKKAAPNRPPRAGDAVSTSVLDGAMKDVIRGSFLKS